MEFLRAHSLGLLCFMWVCFFYTPCTHPFPWPEITSVYWLLPSFYFHPGLFISTPVSYIQIPIQYLQLDNKCISNLTCWKTNTDSSIKIYFFLNLPHFSQWQLYLPKCSSLSHSFLNSSSHFKFIRRDSKSILLKYICCPIIFIVLTAITRNYQQIAWIISILSLLLLLISKIFSHHSSQSDPFMMQFKSWHSGLKCSSSFVSPSVNANHVLLHGRPLRSGSVMSLSSFTILPITHYILVTLASFFLNTHVMYIIAFPWIHKSWLRPLLWQFLLHKKAPPFMFICLASSPTWSPVGLSWPCYAD